MPAKKKDHKGVVARLTRIRQLAHRGGRNAESRLDEIKAIAGEQGSYGKPDDLAKRLAAGMKSVAVRTSDGGTKKKRSETKGRDRMLTTGYDRGAA